MFEYPQSSEPPVNASVNGTVNASPTGEPQEFLYKGRRFRIHAILNRWRESGGWWKRLDSLNNHNLENLNDLNDQERRFWRVEAAQVGALATFEIEFDEATQTWKIRPASRPS
jgi:hypothetical protein